MLTSCFLAIKSKESSTGSLSSINNHLPATEYLISNLGDVIAFGIAAYLHHLEESFVFANSIMQLYWAQVLVFDLVSLNTAFLMDLHEMASTYILMSRIVLVLLLFILSLQTETIAYYHPIDESNLKMKIRLEQLLNPVQEQECNVFARIWFFWVILFSSL